MMERWHLGHDEYWSLPVEAEQDMLLVMEIEAKVQAEKAARDARS